MKLNYEVNIITKITEVIITKITEVLENKEIIIKQADIFIYLDHKLVYNHIGPYPAAQLKYLEGRKLELSNEEKIQLNALSAFLSVKEPEVDYWYNEVIEISDSKNDSEVVETQNSGLFSKIKNKIFG